MVEVVRTDDFDQWLRKLKDRVGRLRIVECWTGWRRATQAMPSPSAGAFGS